MTQCRKKSTEVHGVARLPALANVSRGGCWLPLGWVSKITSKRRRRVQGAHFRAFWLGSELTVTRTVLKMVAVLVVLDGQGMMG